MKRMRFRELAKLVAVGFFVQSLPPLSPCAFCQDVGLAESARSFTRAASTDPSPAMFLPFAQFQIPFNVETSGNKPSEVQLWVSTDEGSSWMMHGRARPEAKHFEFRAAAEGLYLFAVQTLDASGAGFPSQEPPIRVRVDTTKPNAALRADINSEGKLVIDIRVADEHLDPSSAQLRLRTDRDPQWQDVAVQELLASGDVFEGQAVVPLSNCRDVAIILSVFDLAKNEGEATLKYSMPRTAAGGKDMQLASTGTGGRVATAPKATLESIPGAQAWEPSAMPTASQAAVANNPPAAGVGRLAAAESNTPDRAENSVEELPLPPPLPRTREGRSSESHQFTSNEPAAELDVRSLSQAEPDRTVEPPRVGSSSGGAASQAAVAGQAYHCNSRAFSLDYSVEALGGSALADVELWGTEDGGRAWVKWGSDPDRQSPFDVQVGNDGLFGFRMVIVGSNGIVSNRPKDGDSSDVWINIDTERPQARVTRAVYGEGPDEGLLVIDYMCQDSHLHERPISLSFGERPDGPWTPIAVGLANTGIYLWKADPSRHDRIYLKLEAVDKSGNIGVHRLDLPIDIGGLAPRGRIQGFRPITVPQ